MIEVFHQCLVSYIRHIIAEFFAVVLALRHILLKAAGGHVANRAFAHNYNKQNP
jgi:hypothetical protein